MKLTPLDLQQKTFRKVTLGGLDEREVRSWLDYVATQLEDLTRKLNKQDEELRRREARINEFKDREQLLQHTLTTTQKLSEEMKVNARKEAEIIISDAELQAEKIIANAQARRLQLVGEIEELKRARAGFMQQLQALLDTHKSILDHMRGDQPASEPPAPADNVSFLAPPVSKKK
ncbi:MAG TPA: DivIVA domain-containing protein [Myxococcales bacterium]|nr:DivIVA domain-containing protein [Myxococcales bacterium]